MTDIHKGEKKTLRNKLREFEIQGLNSYGKYLNDQLESASKSNMKAAYKKYIEKQIMQNNEKIERLETKLKE